MRIISVDTGSLSKLNDVYQSLEYIAKAGYKYFDLSLYWEAACDHLGTRDDFEEETKKLKAHSDKLGLKCIQSHSYFTSGADNLAVLKRIEIIAQDIIITSMMGANLIVAHPIWEWDVEQNVTFFNTFLPLLEKYNMKMAIENIWGFKDGKIIPICTSTPTPFIELLNQLDKDYFVACLDIGHAEMKDLNTNSIELIKALKDKIATIHIHDNDKKEDLHQIPYTYNIDFDPIFKELKKVGYKGPINFEVERCYGAFPKELYVPVLKLLQSIGEYFSILLDN